VKGLVGSREYKDFEFGRGPHLDANVRYLNSECEINQIADIIDVLKRDVYSKACVAITWHVHEELMRKHKSSPCLVFLQAIVQDERLNLTVFFRSHDMVQGWPENAYGCAAIQKEIADAVGVETGILTIMSGSGQIYRHYYQQVRDMLQKFRKPEELFNDARGNFVIDVDLPLIIAKLVHPQTGKELERFEGETAKEVYTKIAHSIGSLQTSHALYLGTELQKAELRVKGKIGVYQQDADINELDR
jgi:thymidylate synthase